MANSALNPISFRLPSFDLSTEDGRQQAHRYVASGIVDLNQAIAALKSQLDASNTATAVSTSTPSSPITIINSNAFPYLGTVNDQRGNALYLTQITDNGAKIVVADSSPITIMLNALVTAPWFTFIDNDSSSTATLTPSAGSIVGETSIPANGFGIIFFDGADFYCGATMGGATGTIPLGPLTDSGATGSIQVQNGLIISWTSPT